jgi:galactokinase/galacturonokinase
MPASLHERTERLTAEAAALARVARDEVRVVRSPYRVCPLGAHVDHQLGRVTGMALDHSVLLAFAPTADGTVRLRSHEFTGEVEFPLAEAARVPKEGWARYAAGAVLALANAGIAVRRGIAGVVEGELPIGGLSSSAAVTIAYLLALEAANGATVSPEQNIHLEQYVENVHIGLNNGILDQSVILLSRRGQLLYLDCLDESWELLAPPANVPPWGIVVAYSGLSAALTTTGYNQRVAECAAAAAELLRLGGVAIQGPPRLRHVPEEVYEAHVGELPGPLAKRARHFFAENARVVAAREAWASGDLVGLGRLISDSGRSSIDNYECGSPELITLYEVLRDTEGVHGARFSGGGFRGSCIGLYEPGAEEGIVERAGMVFPQAHPHLAEAYQLHFCRSDNGAAMP